MKVRIKVRPTGYISLNGGPLNVWPKVGAVVDLPKVVAEDLIKDGRAEKVMPATKAEPIGETVETRPAPSGEEEQRRRPGRPPAKKQDD